MPLQTRKRRTRAGRSCDVWTDRRCTFQTFHFYVVICQLPSGLDAALEAINCPVVRMFPLAALGLEGSSCLTQPLGYPWSNSWASRSKQSED